MSDCKHSFYLTNTELGVLGNKIIVHLLCKECRYSFEAIIPLEDVVKYIEWS